MEVSLAIAEDRPLLGYLPITDDIRWRISALLIRGIVEVSIESTTVRDTFDKWPLDILPFSVAVLFRDAIYESIHHLTTSFEPSLYESTLVLNDLIFHFIFVIDFKSFLIFNFFFLYRMIKCYVKKSIEEI